MNPAEARMADPAEPQRQVDEDQAIADMEQALGDREQSRLEREQERADARHTAADAREPTAGEPEQRMRDATQRSLEGRQAALDRHQKCRDTYQAILDAEQQRLEELQRAPSSPGPRALAQDASAVAPLQLAEDRRQTGKSTDADVYAGPALPLCAVEWVLGLQGHRHVPFVRGPQR